jgi:hypothetical protein
MPLNQRFKQMRTGISSKHILAKSSPDVGKPIPGSEVLAYGLRLAEDQGSEQRWLFIIPRVSWLGPGQDVVA